MMRTGMAFSVAAALGLASGYGGDASAAVVGGQTPVITNSIQTGGPNLTRQADDFQLAQAATVRSVSWRGVFLNGLPALPLSFDLAILTNDNSDNLPDIGLSATTAVVPASQIVDTGQDNSLGDDIYEFSADIPEVSLAEATTYWFALRIADDPGTSADDFFWSTGGGDRAAFQTNNGSYGSAFFGPFYFELNDEQIPEPAAALGLMALGVIRRRRR